MPRCYLILLLMLMLTAGCGTSSPSSTVGGVEVLEVGTGTRPVVLLHGYSSSPEEWLPFTATIRLPAGSRFVFPRGPERGANGRGRAWWHLDLISHAGSDGLPDLSRTRPSGLEKAAAGVRSLLREYESRDGATAGALVLGGFSQGAMLATDVALRTELPVDGLVLMSGTLLTEDEWTPLMKRRAGMRAMISHGTHDPILPYEGSERLAAAMREAGVEVDFVKFRGQHEIPPVVLEHASAVIRG